MATPRLESEPPAVLPKTHLPERKPVASVAEIRLPVKPTPAPPIALVQPPPPPAVSAPIAASPSAAAPLSPPVKPPPNRRRERRTKVKYNACIRVSGWGEEVVPCEDVSRGGFCFHSKRQYSVETMIEAAVPYMPGGVSIFVPAQIANAAALQGGPFRYGAAYIRSPR